MKPRRVAREEAAPPTPALPVPGGASLLPLEDVALAELHPHPRNYVKHPPDELAHIEASIRAHGVYRNILIARDGTILAGHGVVEACRRLGLERVPVRRLDLDPAEPRALAVLAGDNEIAHLREVDDRALADLLRGVGDAMSTAELDGLLGTGYDRDMLALLVLETRPESEIPDSEAAAAWAGAGLPDYDPVDDLSDAVRLIVLFRDEAARDAFVAEKLPGKPIANCKATSSIWWPDRPFRDERKSKAVVETGNA